MYHTTTTPGYDLDDPDDAPRTGLDRGRLEAYPTDEERRRFRGGERPPDLLDGADIDRLLRGADRPGASG